jgi:hypothetical protein
MGPLPDSDPFSYAAFTKILLSWQEKFAAIPNCRFKFQKRGQLFTRVYYEPFSVVTRGINNRDCSPL